METFKASSDSPNRLILVRSRKVRKVIREIATISSDRERCQDFSSIRLPSGILENLFTGSGLFARSRDARACFEEGQGIDGGGTGGWRGVDGRSTIKFITLKTYLVK